MDQRIWGEFNRSSQHSGIGGYYDGTQTAVGSVWTGGMAWSASSASPFSDALAATTT